MGAPAILSEKLVAGNETILALRTTQRMLASGLCEEKQGKEGDENVAVTLQSLPSGGQMWVANRDHLENIDISNPETIPLVRSLDCNMSVTQALLI